MGSYWDKITLENNDIIVQMSLQGAVGQFHHEIRFPV